MSRKHCGRRRNCSLGAVSSFPTVFSKDLYCRHVKTRACLGKGLEKPFQYCSFHLAVFEETSMYCNYCIVVCAVMHTFLIFCDFSIITEIIYFKFIPLDNYLKGNLHNSGR